MHAMLIGFHEASHGLLRKTRRLNEIDGIIIGIFSLMSFSLYRAAHQLHHAYLATERLKHHEKVASAPRGRIPRGLSAKQRMARKLRTKTGRETYAKRKGMIEPIFGQLKQVLGFRQFSMRGLSSMRGEWRLMATVHNLLKLWRHDRQVEMVG